MKREMCAHGRFTSSACGCTWVAEVDITVLPEFLKGAAVQPSDCAFFLDNAQVFLFLNAKMNKFYTLLHLFRIFQSFFGVSCHFVCTKFSNGNFGCAK